MTPKYFIVCDLSIDTPSIATVGFKVWTMLLFRENDDSAAFVGFTSAPD